MSEPTNDKAALVSNNTSNPFNTLSLVGLIASALMIVISLILSGLNYSEVYSSSLCSNDVSYTECYFNSVESVNVANPDCGAYCYKTSSGISGNAEFKASTAYYTLANFMGEMRSVYNDLTGNYTLLSQLIH
jgi:hypothetical protein